MLEQQPRGFREKDLRHKRLGHNGPGSHTEHPGNRHPKNRRQIGRKSAIEGRDAQNKVEPGAQREGTKENKKD